MTCRKDIDESQNQGRGIILGQGWRLPAYWPTGLRHIDGENAIRALIWNVGTCRDNVKGACQAGSTCKILSTNVSHRGGPDRSSEEVSVMGMERRVWPMTLKLIAQPERGGGKLRKWSSRKTVNIGRAV